MAAADLLPPDALMGRRVGISVSPSADLDRLGLRETHFRLALGEITRAVLVAGGGILYGGHLDPDGYTGFVVTEMHRYARRDRPLVVCLAWHEHRRVSLSDLDRFRRKLSLYGRMVCLDIDGSEIPANRERGEQPSLVTDPELQRRALTGLRQYMRDHERGRVFLGGRRRGFQGVFPGLVEETLVCLRARQPIYLAGGFGGVTLDIVRALGIDTSDWFEPDRTAPTAEPGLAAGLARLRDFAADRDYTGLNNGLTDEENRWLAAAHRPSDIAALVTLGLGRVGAMEQATDNPFGGGN